MIDHKFNDTYSANLTTDATYDGTTGASQVFIKKAYLQASTTRRSTSAWAPPIWRGYPSWKASTAIATSKTC